MSRRSCTPLSKQLIDDTYLLISILLFSGDLIHHQRSAHLLKHIHAYKSWVMDMVHSMDYNFSPDNVTHL